MPKSAHATTPAQIATLRCLAGERGPDSLATLEERAKEAIFALCCCGSGAAWGDPAVGGEARLGPSKR